MDELEGAPSSGRRRRGVGFPLMPLQDAVDAVVTAGQNGPAHTHDAFATYLGHRTANSGAFRTKLASLRDWGLIARGDRDQVFLSELAQDLMLAVPDHYEAKELLLRSFESCRLFAMLYADSAKRIPVDISRLRTTVLMRYGVASTQADRLVDSFVKSAVFAGIAESDGTKVTLLPRESVFSDSSAEVGAAAKEPVAAAESVAEAPPLTVSPEVTLTSTTSRPAIPVALRQAWPIDGGEIEFVIRTSEPLPPNIYALVAELAQVVERMALKLTGPLVEITGDPPAAYQTHSVREQTDN